MAKQTASTGYFNKEMLAILKKGEEKEKKAEKKTTKKVKGNTDRRLR